MAALTPLDNLLQFHQNALNLRAFRQQLLASNIANADTPGYKARDIDFAAALRDVAAGRSVSLRVSSDRHLGAATREDPAAVLYRSAQQPSIDGNTVDMDVERNRFAENAVHYDANLTFLNSQIKLMLAALQGVMLMSLLLNVFEIAGSAMTAQSQRLNVVASNLANADSVTSSNSQPYRAKQVVFSELAFGGATGSGVKVTRITEDASPGKQVFDPKHPLADAQGYVAMPNVSTVDEMVNMIAAARSYQNNVEMMNTAKALMLKTLTLGQ